MIDKFIGIPYKHNGRDFDGMDCLGIVFKYLEANGIQIPAGDGRFIEKNWYEENPERLLDGLKSRFQKVNDVEPYDIALFQFKGIPRHLGVMISKTRFLHAREGHRSSIMRLDRYKRFFHSAYRVVK